MKLSLLHRYRCTTMDLYTKHAPVLKQMTELDSLRVLILGDSGTGKSTICRNLIHTYYGVNHEDVMQISSLNDQGIHFYRNEVRTFCQTTSVKKKMIVLDDMDAMVESGQQIFLSYMDAFPRILFVITATCPVKIIQGIHSRLLTLRLDPFSNTYLREELTRISKLEGLEVDDAAADLLVTRASNSMRTMMNCLEKIILLGKGLTRDTVDACSTLDSRVVEAFSEAIEKRDEYEAVDLVLGIHRDGYSVMDILDAYFHYVKHSSLSDVRKYDIVRVIAKYIAIFNQHEHVIELIFCVHDLCVKEEESLI